jgi:hypothetical protein
MPKKQKYSKSYKKMITPTYDSLNAFMRPSVLSPKYQYPKLRNYSNSPESPASRESRDSHNYEHSDTESDDHTEGEGECNVSYRTDGSYATSAVDKDHKIYEMKCLLDKKRKAFHDKNNEVRRLATDNQFLSDVVSDYENSQHTILDEKKKQKLALEVLSEHIRNISKNIKNDEFQLRRIRDDQKMLIDEIDKLRRDVDYIRSKIERSMDAIDTPETISDNSDNMSDDVDYMSDDDVYDSDSDEDI